MTPEGMADFGAAAAKAFGSPASPWLPVGVRPTEAAYYWIDRGQGEPDEYPIQIVRGARGLLWVRDAWLRKLAEDCYDRCRFALAAPPPLPDPAEEMAEHLDGLRDPGTEVAPRNLYDVLDRIIAEIPANLTSERSAVERLKTSALYTPPEGMPARWTEARMVLYAYIGEPKEPWQRRIAAIFAGTEVPR